MTVQPEQALGQLPESLRDELLDAFNEVVRNFRERRWEPSELNAGKLCEVVYTILRGHVDGKFPVRAKKPGNMVDRCRDFEQAGKEQFPRSVRVTIPRTLIALYEFRNNRGVGHVGGDVDANHMDAVFLMQASKWVLAELVRIFHDVDVDAATEVVDALTDRTIPIIWEVDGKKRVLDPGLPAAEKTLLLLYSESGPVDADALLEWTEYGNPSRYRNKVLPQLHDRKLIDYDAHNGVVHLSPRGSTHVEEELTLHIS